MVGRLTLLLVVALVMVVITPGRVAACTCGTPEEGRAGAEVAFTGVVASSKGQPVTPWYNTGDPVTYTFVVEQPLKGDPGPVIRILSAIESSACGLPMAVGQRWSIYAYGWEGDLWTGICNGNQLLASDGSVPEVPNQGLPVVPIWIALTAGLLASAGGFLALLAHRRRRGIS